MGYKRKKIAEKDWSASIPIADNRKESVRALNRRVEVVKVK